MAYEQKWILASWPEDARLAGERELADQYGVRRDTFSTESSAYPEFGKPE
jgi:hypothetical protein